MKRFAITTLLALILGACSKPPETSAPETREEEGGPNTAALTSRAFRDEIKDSGLESGFDAMFYSSRSIWLTEEGADRILESPSCTGRMRAAEPWILSWEMAMLRSGVPVDRVEFWKVVKGDESDDIQRLFLVNAAVLPWQYSGLTDRNGRECR